MSVALAELRKSLQRRAAGGQNIPVQVGMVEGIQESSLTSNSTGWRLEDKVHLGLDPANWQSGDR